MTHSLDRVAARATTNAGIYLGTVTRVAGATAYVEVPRLNAGFEYPARYPAELAGATTLPAGEGPHTHGLRALAGGDPVACAFLEGGRDELVVLLRLA